MGNLVFQATLGGQVNLVGPNTASTFNINVPTVNGNMVTTGDTGTVTNTMLAGSIANAKLTNSSVTIGGTSIALGASSSAITNDITINGLTVGKGAGAVSTNTAVGASALAANTTGSGVTAFGYNALNLNTSGTGTAFGYVALAKATTADGNSAFGSLALYNTTTGSYNVAVGLQALQSNTTASNNTAVGYQSLYSNTTASRNTAVGGLAGYSTTTGHVTAIGYQVLNLNTTGTGNTGVGGNDESVYGALQLNTTGSYNIAVGTGALSQNTTASYNTAVGYQAGYSNTTGYSNTSLGYVSGYSLTTGYLNTFVGKDAGFYVTTGAKNTILGAYTGNQGGLDIRTVSNSIVISDGDGVPRFVLESTGQGHVLNSPTGSSYVVCNYDINMVQKAQTYWDNLQSRFYVISGGSGGVYLSSGGTSWTSASDERAKDIIEPIANAANKVSTLRAVIGKYKNDEAGTRRSFLIAQDVLAVLPEAVTVPEEGATEKDGSPAMMGVEYTAVIPLLVAAIKELKAEIDTLKGQA